MDVSLFRRTVVVGIIGLFIGTSFFPPINGDVQSRNINAVNNNQESLQNIIDQNMISSDTSIEDGLTMGDDLGKGDISSYYSNIENINNEITITKQQTEFNDINSIPSPDNYDLPAYISFSLNRTPIVNQSFQIIMKIVSDINLSNYHFNINFSENIVLEEGNISHSGCLNKSEILLIENKIKIISLGDSSISTLLTNDTREVNKYYYFTLNETDCYCGYNPKPMYGKEIENVNIINVTRGDFIDRGEVKISGKWVFYDQSKSVLKPIKYAKVELYRKGLLWDDCIRWGRTNEKGEYQFGADAGETYRVHLIAESSHTKIYEPGWLGGEYTWTTGWEKINSDTYYYCYPDGNDRGVWEVYNNILDEFLWFQNKVGYTGPQTKVTCFEGDNSAFHPMGLVWEPYINIASAHQWSRDTHIHEYAHAIMHDIYDSDPSGWGPDPHYIHSESSSGFAISEGWAEFCSCAVDNSDIIWSLESGYHADSVDNVDWDGNIVEGAVANILWDIFDGTNTNDYPSWSYFKYGDYINNKFDNIWRIIKDDNPSSMVSFWHTYNRRLAPDFNTWILFYHNRIFPNGIFTNNPFYPNGIFLNLNIIKPTETSTIYAGPYDNPNKISIEASLKTYDNIFIKKFTDTSCWEIKIGGQLATIISITELSDKYVIEITPPKVSAAGVYDLYVKFKPPADVCGPNQEATKYSSISYSGTATQQGVDIALIIDSSGSMAWNDAGGYRKTAAKYFVDLMATGDKVSVVDFGYGTCGVRYLQSLTELTSTTSRTNVKNQINQIDNNGATPMGQGLKYGYDELVSYRAVQNHVKAAILLTDGQETCSGVSLARQYANKFAEKGFQLYTIGLTGEVDEQLLIELANTANGDYYKAPSNTVLQQIYSDISKSVSNQQSATSGLGSIGRSREYDYWDVNISQECTKARFIVNWFNNNSDINLSLQDPTGTYIYPNSSDPLINFTSGEIYEFYTINSPLPGNWKMIIDGKNVVPEGENYSINVYVSSNLTMNLLIEKTDYIQGDAIKITAVFSNSTSPITNASIVVTEEWQPFREQFILYDDGQHDDGLPYDGIYANYYSNTNEPGVYTFIAHATYTEPGFGEITREDRQSVYVYTNQNPVAIAGDPYYGIVNEPIVFDASNSYDLDGEITSYYWEFGDGTNSTGMSPCHSYQSNGVYNVNLTVKDNHNLTSFDSTIGTINGYAPVASIISPSTAEINTLIEFNASNSYDPDGIIIDYVWDFGDGTPSQSGEIIYHSYTAAGTYIVSLTVTDNNYVTNTITTQVVAGNLPPDKPLPPYGPRIVNKYVNYSYLCSAIDDNIDDQYYMIDWGDGTYSSWLGPYPSGYIIDVNHSWSMRGKYEIRIKAKDILGQESPWSESLFIRVDPLPTVFVDDDYTNSTPGWKYDHFNNIQEAINNVDSEGTIYVYEGAYYENIIINKSIHLYGIDMKNTSINGGSNTAIMIMENHTTISGFSIKNANVGIYINSSNNTLSYNNITDNSEYGVIITATSFNNTLYHNNFINNYQQVYATQNATWNLSYPLGGNYWDDYTGIDQFSGSAQNEPVHDGIGDTSYSISTMGTDWHPLVKPWGNNLPYTRFSDFLDRYGNVYLDATSSIDRDGTIVEYLWDFDDGSTGTGAYAEHQFQNYGTYHVTLTLTDNLGDVETFSRDIYYNDTLEPWISSVECNSEAMILHNWVNISCTIDDNVGINIVNINISNTTTTQNVTMINIGGTNVYYYNSTYHGLGIHNFFIYAKDIHDNPVRSDNYNFVISAEYDVGITQINEPPLTGTAGLFSPNLFVKNYCRSNQSNITVSLEIRNYSSIYPYLAENFSGTYPPEGWTIDNRMRLYPDYMAGGIPPELALLYYRDHNISFLETKPVDTSSATNLYFNFKTYFYPIGCQSSFRLLMRSDSTHSWTDITTWDNPNSGWYDYFAFNISSFIGSATQIRLETSGIPQGSNGYLYWFMDDFLVYSFTDEQGEYYDEKIINISESLDQRVFFSSWVPSDWTFIENKDIQYFVRAQIQSDNDQNDKNDEIITTTNLHFPYFHDAGVINIISPSSGKASILQPKVESKNFGQLNEATIPVTCIIHEKNISAIHSEGFENSNGSFHAANGVWEWGTPLPSIPPYSSYNSDKCWGTNLSGNYPKYTTSILITPLLQLPDGRIELSYWQWYNFSDDYEGGNVKLSTDNGNNWIVLNTAYTSWTNILNNTGIWESCFGYNYGNYWHKITIDLTDYANNEILLAWHFGSLDGDSQGWYIDNITMSYYNWTEVYNETVISSIHSLETIQTLFPEWTPLNKHNYSNIDYTIAFTTNLIDDSDAQNNMIEGSFTLEFIHDVGVKKILQPSSRTSNISWISYDGGNNDNCFGGSLVDWEAAIRLTKDELTNHEGSKLSTVKFYHCDYLGDGFLHVGAIKIYGEGTETKPGELLSSEPFQVGAEGWFEITLSNPVYIVANEELWVSVQISQRYGDYPIGVSSNQKVIGKGLWYKEANGEWIEYSSPQYNWNIQAGVERDQLSLGTYPITVSVKNYGIFTDTFAVNASLYQVINGTDYELRYADSLSQISLTSNEEKILTFNSVTFNQNDSGEYCLHINLTCQVDQNLSNNLLSKYFIVNTSNMLQYNLNLNNQWNLICVPVDTTLMASDLANRITGCQMISRFDSVNQTYKTFIVGGPPSFDFPIIGGYGYFVLVDQSSTLSVSGYRINTVSVPLSVGWNMIGWYHSSDTSASSLRGNVSGCQMISWFDAMNQTFKTFIVGGPPSFDFTVRVGMGLFVLVNTASVWHGEG